MSRWTTAFASMILLAFSLPAAAADDDMPRNIELKPGAQATDSTPADATSPDLKTRQIVTEGKDASPADAAKDGATDAGAKPDTPAAADKAPEPAQAAAPPAPPESAPPPAKAEGPASGGGKPPAETGVAAPAAPEPEPENLALAIQTELKRVGCDPGEVDGVWGGRSREALAAFGHFAKADVANLAPTPEIFHIIKGKTAVVCGVEAEGADPQPAHPTPPSDHHGDGGYEGGGYGGGGGGY